MRKLGIELGYYTEIASQLSSPDFDIPSTWYLQTNSANSGICHVMRDTFDFTRHVFHVRSSWKYRDDDSTTSAPRPPPPSPDTIRGPARGFHEGGTDSACSYGCYFESVRQNAFLWSQATCMTKIGPSGTNFPANGSGSSRSSAQV